jgi:outer membrane receptor protein involved in Fe transport
VQANAALVALLDSRTGDDTRLTSDAACIAGGKTASQCEAFRYTFRSLWAGLRQSNYDNTVVQFLGGVRGELGDTGWDYEVSVSEGRTEIPLTQRGNFDTQVLHDILLNPATLGGVCATWSFFGNVAPPDACADRLLVDVNSNTILRQQIGQAFVRGDIAELPAGGLATVFGIEYRRFDYESFYYGTPGPFSGFNVGNPDAGNNTFFDLFGEALIPLHETLELSLGYRRSEFEFNDLINDIEGESQSSDAYKIELNWNPMEALRLRGSYQHSVRAPNFAELFSGGNSFPQFFDPCSTFTAFRAGQNGAAVDAAALCAATGVQTPATFNAPPGGQAPLSTDGNPNLEPESADTYTIGLIFQSPRDDWTRRFQASIDYYSIALESPILVPDVNTSLAACYNYYGTNPSLTVAGNPYCGGIVRSGGILAFFSNPNDPNGLYPGVNGGVLETDGIDIQFQYGWDWAWMGMPESAGSMTINVLLNHVMSFKQADAPDNPDTPDDESLPTIDYAGTIGFFGTLGQSFPDWKATINATWDIGDFSFDARARYISSMENRVKVIFPGETFFGFTFPQTTIPFPDDVDAQWYLDLAGTWNITEIAQLRLGVNNVFDEQPPEYAPNFQSGTDPSTYDIIGRRFFGQVALKF